MILICGYSVRIYMLPLNSSVDPLTGGYFHEKNPFPETNRRPFTSYPIIFPFIQSLFLVCFAPFL